MIAPLIQLATETDSPAIHACLRAAFAPYVASIENFPDVTEGLDACIAQGQVFVAKEKGHLLGAMTIEVQDVGLKIGVLGVDSAQKGRGLGRSFVEFAERHARSLGLAQMQLKTHVLLTQNVSLYEHLGWHVTGRGDHTVSMARLL